LFCIPPDILLMPIIIVLRVRSVIQYLYISTTQKHNTYIHIYDLFALRIIHIIHHHIIYTGRIWNRSDCRYVVSSEYLFYRLSPWSVQANRYNAMANERKVSQKQNLPKHAHIIITITINTLMYYAFFFSNDRDTIPIIHTIYILL